MKGIILAGGKATRLRPLTKVTSKQLLPVYNKPMIFYPINTLVKAGIKDILIIISPEYAGHFLNLLGSGEEFGAKFSYEIQENSTGGLAEAIVIGEEFINGDTSALILGDNIFEHDFSESFASFEKGARIFAKKVDDPERFGVVEFNQDNKVISLEEKPINPKSNFAAVGLYLYDSNVTTYVKTLKPSLRGQLEITDLNSIYLEKGILDVNIIEGLWEDAGTFDSLLRASNLIAEKVKKGENI